MIDLRHVPQPVARRVAWWSRSSRSWPWWVDVPAAGVRPADAGLRRHRSRPAAAPDGGHDVRGRADRRQGHGRLSDELERSPAAWAWRGGIFMLRGSTSAATCWTWRCRSWCWPSARPASRPYRGGHGVGAAGRDRRGLGHAQPGAQHGRGGGDRAVGHGRRRPFEGNPGDLAMGTMVNEHRSVDAGVLPLLVPSRPRSTPTPRVRRGRRRDGVGGADRPARRPRVGEEPGARGVRAAGH